MPGFAQVLNDEEIAQAIAWFQSKWPDQPYTIWLDINQQAQQSN